MIKVNICQIKHDVFSIPFIQYTDTDIQNMLGNHPFDTRVYDMDFIRQYVKNTISINEPRFFVHFSLENAGHCMCQLIHHIFLYKQLYMGTKIIVSKCVLTQPFLYKLVCILFEDSTPEILEYDTEYRFTNVCIPRYIWFTDKFLCVFEKNIIDNISIKTYTTPVYANIKETSSNTIDELQFFNKIINVLCSQHKHKYETYDKIFIAKTQQCVDSTTPLRSLFLSKEVFEHLKKRYHIILPHLITDIIEHIVLLKSAKEIITSYGCVSCTNRFFFNETAVIKLICNVSYNSEYTEHEHINYCIYTVYKYMCFLDIDNDIGLDAMYTITNA